jgi:hypothetical protein
MLAASPAMIALLNGQQILMADLLTITLVDGTIVRLTSADMDIISGGNTFTSKGIQFTRGKTKTMIGTQVDTLDLSLFGDSTKLIGGYPVVQAAQLGVLDGAYVTLERAMMPTWGDTSAGTIKRFAGRVAEQRPRIVERAIPSQSVSGRLHPHALRCRLHDQQSGQEVELNCQCRNKNCLHQHRNGAGGKLFRSWLCYFHLWPE